jgi:hypothetical protein
VPAAYAANYWAEAMSTTIRVKVRPDHRLKFPAICAHCGQPADENMKIFKRRGTITRMIHIPLCGDCHQMVSRKSWVEERWLRLGKVLTIGVAIAVLVAGNFLLPAFFPGWLRLISAVILSLLLALGLRGVYRQRSAELALPEKKEILGSARMTKFSWRVTTFVFSRSDFAKRFSELNKEKLMPGELS